MALVVVAILVVAAYFYYGKPNTYIPSGGQTTSIATQQADAAAISALDSALNSATQNISSSNIESAIASQ